GILNWLFNASFCCALIRSAEKKEVSIPLEEPFAMTCNLFLEVYLFLRIKSYRPFALGYTFVAQLYVSFSTTSNTFLFTPVASMSGNPATVCRRIGTPANFAPSMPTIPALG